MKKNGFTIVELLVSFSLVMVICIFLFQIVLLMRDLFTTSGIKTELINKQSLISRQINDNFLEKGLNSINKCGSNCLLFIYKDGTTSKLVIDKIYNTLTFDEYITKLDDGSNFGDIDIDVALELVSSRNKNNAFLYITIPIVNKLFKNYDFGINVVYQYNTYNTKITNVVFDDNTSKYGYVILIDDKNMTVNNEQQFNDPGYILYNSEGNSSLDTSRLEIINPFESLMPPYELGTYIIQYNLKDENDVIVQTLERKVNVIENYKIELAGQSNEVVLRGQNYVDPGYSISNSSINNMTNQQLQNLGYNLVVTNNVNTSVNGSYEITYKLYNDSNELVAYKKREVLVATMSLSLIDNATIGIIKDNSFNDPGVHMTSNILNQSYADFINEIVINEKYDLSLVRDSNLDTSNYGYYNLTYKIMNGENVVASVVRNVAVANSVTKVGNVTSITYNFDYTGEAQTFTVPTNGNYKVELWGAQGNHANNGRSFGGNGAYTSGIISLNTNNTLYFNIGQHRDDRLSSFNANSVGGSGRDTGDGGDYNGYGGGGATDVRRNGTDLVNRIIVAAGGGGATDYAAPANGGAAGGMFGYSGINMRKTNCGVVNTPPTGGTQSNGGETSVITASGGLGTVGILGYGGNGNTSWGSGGGGGYYGGGGGGYTSCSVDSGAGGSSYISGHNGCTEISTSIFTNTVMIDGAGYSWTNTKGNLSAMPNPLGGSYQLGTGNVGNGYAKISLLITN